MELRLKRNWAKKFVYDSRRKSAISRPRANGRFIKKGDKKKPRKKQPRLEVQVAEPHPDAKNSNNVSLESDSGGTAAEYAQLLWGRDALLDM